MSRVERIYNALIKHQGRQIGVDSNRIEIDLSVLLELFALEDYIKELEETITKQEAIIVNLDTQLKFPKWNGKEFKNEKKQKINKKRYERNRN